MTTAPVFSEQADAPVWDLDALADDDQEAEEQPVPEHDPDAPYGRFANGKPRKSPAGSRSGGAKKPGRRRVPGAPRRTAAKKPAGPDYAAASMSLVAVAQAATGLAGTLMSNTAFRADTATLVVMGPAIAQVSGDLAQQNAQWAGILERMGTAGKWSAPMFTAFGLCMQVAVNHGVIPAGVMGTRPPAEMMEAAAAILEEQASEYERATQPTMGAAA